MFAGALGIGTFTSVRTFVFYLALGMAVSGQSSPETPQSQPPQQHSISPKLSPTEVSALKAKAEKGDASAEFSLGRAYEEGNGVPKSDESAMKWYRKAADQGDAEAQNRVGVLYSLGLGIGRDRVEAVAWYHKAARQKNAKAMFNLGAAYYNGDGLAIDDVASCAWFLLAQEAGSTAADEALRRAASENRGELSAALVKVAEIYAAGNELPKDSAEALKWYRKAADAGDARSAVTVAGLLLGPGRALTQDEYAEARRRCEDAANQKYAPGAYCVAVIHKRGLGMAKDPVESAKWFARTAELGDSRAAFELGEAYWKGDGVKPDPVTAYMWIWLAYNSRVPGAEQDEQELRREMTAKQVEHAKQKASDWSKNHRFLVLRQRQTDNAPPAQ